MLQGDAEFASHSWEGLSTGSIDSVRKNCKTPPGPGSLRGNGWLGVGYAVGGNRKLDTRLGQRMRGEEQPLLQAASRGRCGAV